MVEEGEAGTSPATPAAGGAAPSKAERRAAKAASKEAARAAKAEAKRAAKDRKAAAKVEQAAAKAVGAQAKAAAKAAKAESKASAKAAKAEARAAAKAAKAEARAETKRAVEAAEAALAAESAEDEPPAEDEGGAPEVADAEDATAPEVVDGEAEAVVEAESTDDVAGEALADEAESAMAGASGFPRADAEGRPDWHAGPPPEFQGEPEPLTAADLDDDTKALATAAEPEEPRDEAADDLVVEAVVVAEVVPVAESHAQPEVEAVVVTEAVVTETVLTETVVTDLVPADEPVADPDAAGIPVMAAPTNGTAGTTIGAAIDVGANSVHLLVAATGGHRVEPLLDESVFLGLGDRVAREGRMGPEARAEVVRAVSGYVDTARRMSAGDVTLVGTEPVRRAYDAAHLVVEAESNAGLALHVLDHDEEAMLTLLGVTKGARVKVDTLVVDIGGGSSELLLAGPGRPVRAVGLRLGSAQLTQDLVHSDPPTLAELDALREAARAALVEAPDATPERIIAVGGTASNLLRLLPATAVDRVLTRRRIAVAMAMLTVERSAEAAERHGIRPQRARILPAGAVIVDAILERYGIDRVEVSEEGIREGAVLAAAVAGPAWRDRLPTLVAGWDDEGSAG